LPPCIARMKCQRARYDHGGDQEQRDRVSHPWPRMAASLSSSWIRLGHPTNSPAPNAGHRLAATTGATRLPQRPTTHGRRYSLT
jgi:hypothetical protein